MKKLLLLLVSALLTTSALALDNGLAKTPPMGWNSWNKFACNVSEQLIRDTADTMISTGMLGAGYQYLVIDDCWQVSRDAQGNIVADPQRFPSGMKALADYVHSKGLKFGLYSDAGLKTCQGRPGSRGFEYQDARQYAAWGVDYLKYDWCEHGTQDAPSSYQVMRDALKASGRPIVFSLCEWGSSKPWLWASDVGNLWRATGDIQDMWEGKKDWGGLGMVNIVDQEADNKTFAYSGPGHWNDPDMLEVGNGGMTTNEYRSHFSLWAMLAAPLIAGNDLRNMSPDIRDILLNKEVIAVDQDALGREGQRVRKEGDTEVWARPLADGGRAVILFNRGKGDANMRANWAELGYPVGLRATVHDVWQHKDVGSFSGSYATTVPSHGVVMVTLKP
ncbi:MAG TPA: alpha-galactosidase [Terriglobales bacterium]